MKEMKKRSTIAALLGAVVMITAGSLGNEAAAQGRRPQGPPPEAYTACEGLSAGDTAEFESPHGDTITGTCEAEGDRLVLRPDNPPPRGGGRAHEDD